LLSRFVVDHHARFPELLFELLGIIIEGIVNLTCVELVSTTPALCRDGGGDTER
jgi:hypothetical protein